MPTDPALDLGSLALPLDLLNQVIAIIGRRGSGKTHTASVLAEEFIEAGLPICALDPLGVWFGLRSSSDGQKAGLPVTIVGGRHGDVPLERTGGAVVADLVIDQPGAYLVDLSSFESKAAERQFAADFAERLYRAAGNQPRAMHLIVDEADTFAPQTLRRGDEGAARMLGAFEAIARRGRARGLGLTMITQRPAVLNKNLLSQVEVMLSHQVTAPQDRQALREWAEGHAMRDKVQTFLESLAGLQRGEAWLWSPSWLQRFERVTVRPRHTFDSSATPRAGETRIEPQVLAAVDIEALRERMAATIERAKADDPRELRAHIRELEKDIAKLQSSGALVDWHCELHPDVDPATMWGCPDCLFELRRENRQLHAEADLQRPKLIQLIEAIAQLVHRLDDIDHIRARIDVEYIDREDAADLEAHNDGEHQRHSLRDLSAGVSAGNRRVGADASLDSPVVLGTRGDIDGRGRRVDEAGGTGLEGLRRGARRIVEELVARYPATWTRPQIGALTHFAHRGGTFTTYLGELKRRGLVLEHNGVLSASETAVELLGRSVRAPATHEEMMARWRQSLRSGNYRMLEAVVEAGAQGLSRDELAGRLDMTASGGTFGTYLSVLRRNGLVDERSGLVVATEVLWP